MLFRSLRRLSAFALLVAPLFSIFFAAPSAYASDSAVRLVTFGDALPVATLRDEIARETHRPVDVSASQASGPTVTITWHASERELAVAFDEPGRGTVSRIVAASGGADETAHMAALLAASLIQNDADAILGKTRTSSPPAASPSTKEPEEVVAYASLFPPLSSNLNQPYARTRFGFNAIFGRAGELHDGLQLGLINAIIGGKEGATGDALGVQLAPFPVGFNFASGNLRGAQLSWVGNLASGQAHGMQLGALNIAADQLRGVQVGAVNVAGGDSSGVQIGIVNTATKMTGTQIGLVNVTTGDMEGFPLGLISVSGNGGVHPVAWGGTQTYGNAGIKFATNYTYTMLAVHYLRLGEQSVSSLPTPIPAGDFFGAGFFLGGRIPIVHPLSVTLDIGLSGYIPQDRQTSSQYVAQPRVRVLALAEIAKHFRVFAGGGATGTARFFDTYKVTELLHFTVGPEFVAGIEL